MWWWLLWACGGDPQPTEPLETPEVSSPAADQAAANVPKPVETPTEAVTEAPVELPSAAEPAALDGKWLIILSSEREAGTVPASLEVLKGLSQPSAPATLNSSRYKNLMPCYEVVIANAFDDRREAVAYSKALTEAGVSNYPKNAGKWVGQDSRIDAFCAHPDDIAGVCPSGVRMVEDHGGSTYVYLGADAATTERGLQGASASAPIDDVGHVWASPLPKLEQLAGWSLGDSVTVSGLAEPRTCAVASFVALTRGTPHFAWSKDQGRPGCGTPELFAKLDCYVDGGLLAARPQDGTPAVGTPVKVTEAQGESAAAALGKNAAYRSVKKAAKAAAEEVGATLENQRIVTGFELGGTAFARVEVWMYTGEGFDMCGGEDVNVAVAGIVNLATGEVVSPWREVAPKMDVVLVDVDGDGTPEVHESTWPGVREVVDAEGEPTCAVEVSFCDCAC